MSHRPPLDLIIRATRHVLHNNVFEFDGKLYRQICGTAMGTPMAPTAANLFMAKFEKELLLKCPWKIQQDLWKRYIDDIFFLWTSPPEDLPKFEKWANSLHPTIKFTLQSSNSDITFLDLHIHLQEGYFQTDLHCKPTDTHALLHFKSFHPHHCKRAIPYGQLLRLRRICSDDTVFAQRAEQLRIQLLHRGYPHHLFQRAFNKVKSLPREDIMKYKTTKKIDSAVMVVTNNPCNPPLRQWVREGIPSLHSSLRMKEVLPTPPLITCRNPHSLRKILMPSRLPQLPSTDPPGSWKCQKNRCVICQEHHSPTSTFKDHKTGTLFNIRDSMTCETSNIVYLIYCNKCPTARYVGETMNSLKTRFYLHRNHIKKNAGTHLTSHFNKPDHSLQDMRCHGIEIVRHPTLDARLNREAFWRNKLHTLFPEGLNTLN